jgi:hypothetical protein
MILLIVISSYMKKLKYIPLMPPLEGRWAAKGGSEGCVICSADHIQCLSALDDPSVSFADSSPKRGAERRSGETEGKEVAGVSEVKNSNKTETARMMEVIAKMTLGMGGILAVCVGNIIQSLWGLSSKQGIQDARNILDWLEANYDFG